MTGTSTIDIAPQIPAVARHLEWNGQVEDRMRARAVLDEVLAQGGVLAAVWTGPHEAVQVGSFADVEAIERERGTVQVTVTPQIRGG